MKLFNIQDDGSREIVTAIGLISSDVDFSKWEPVLPLGIRDVTAIIGPEPVNALAKFYAGDIAAATDGSPAATDALKYLQQAVALFTWLKIIPTLDAQHDGTGRSRRLGENEKGLTALQEFKDEQNILRLAYEATDALIEIMDREAFPFWVKSRKYNLRKGLLIQSKEEFDEYYNIGSHRLFVTLLPIIREVQGAQVAPVLGRKYLSLLLSGEDSEITDLLKEPAARAVALLTMQKAIERLPVEVIPEGVVQIQQSQPVNSRLRAEQSARAAVAASLGADAKKYIENIQDTVAQLDAKGETPDHTMPGPIVHSKGMSF
ncbi:DUF6712 family protein [uncultured Alistipes sp.]|uniref:DUF6712 family protein n=1 Tax=uncultured Alistipes sp. TaxID=538949 RepID=UPI00260294C1|nr:DUF6712 family protein [uncultured Alistipes sp.]